MGRRIQLLVADKNILWVEISGGAQGSMVVISDTFMRGLSQGMCEPNTSGNGNDSPGISRMISGGGGPHSTCDNEI